MASFVRPVLVSLALSLAIPSIGCGHPRTPAELIADLKNPEAPKRRDAADRLRTDQGVPKEAIGPLLEAASTEKDPRVVGAILITLGRSGVPEAKPLIDQQIPSMDKDMRRWAARALKFWMIENHQLDKDAQLPDGWPYGQPGFPPPLPKD